MTKRLFSRMLLASAFSSVVTLPALATTETYNLDPTHTYVLWHINHFGFSNPSGKWLVSGKLILDEENPQNSKVTANINMNDVVTGIPKLDDHLRSTEFFNVALYPTATFVSNKVELTSKNTAKVSGILTLHGISQPIVLNMTLNQIGVSPVSQIKTAGFSGTAELNRSDYGISAYLPGLGNDVKIEIEAEADLA